VPLSNSDTRRSRIPLQFKGATSVQEGEQIHNNEEISDYRERFLASLSRWSKADYEDHWLKALRRLLSAEGKSALITVYQHPSESSHLEWWPLFREHDTVYVQNHILVFGDLPRLFREEEAFSFLSSRRTVDEDGEAVSQWQTSIEDIRRFLETAGSP